MRIVVWSSDRSGSVAAFLARFDALAGGDDETRRPTVVMGTTSELRLLLVAGQEEPQATDRDPDEGVLVVHVVSPKGAYGPLPPEGEADSLNPVNVEAGFRVVVLPLIVGCDPAFAGHTLPPESAILKGQDGHYQVLPPILTFTEGYRGSQYAGEDVADRVHHLLSALSRSQDSFHHLVGRMARLEPSYNVLSVFCLEGPTAAGARVRAHELWEEFSEGMTISDSSESVEAPDLGAFQPRGDEGWKSHLRSGPYAPKRFSYWLRSKKTDDEWADEVRTAYSEAVNSTALAPFLKGASERERSLSDLIRSSAGRLDERLSSLLRKEGRLGEARVLGARTAREGAESERARLEGVPLPDSLSTLVRGAQEALAKQARDLWRARSEFRGLWKKAAIMWLALTAVLGPALGYLLHSKGEVLSWAGFSGSWPDSMKAGLLVAGILVLAGVLFWLWRAHERLRDRFADAGARFRAKQEEVFSDWLRQHTAWVNGLLAKRVLRAHADLASQRSEELARLEGRFTDLCEALRAHGESGGCLPTAKPLDPAEIHDVEPSYFARFLFGAFPSATNLQSMISRAKLALEKLVEDELRRRSNEGPNLESLKEKIATGLEASTMAPRRLTGKSLLKILISPSDARGLIGGSEWEVISGGSSGRIVVAELRSLRVPSEQG